MKELRRKSVLLTGYLELLLIQHLSSVKSHESHGSQVTGKTSKQTGAQLCIVAMRMSVIKI